jgi:hypothetical protein
MSAKDRWLRLRDWLSGHRDPPPRESGDTADLINEIASADEIDVEEAARQCGQRHAQMWERAERMLEEEKRDQRR